MAATVGFLEAMAIGFFAAIILFARAAGRIDILHARHTLATRTSRTERTDADMRKLARDGRDIVVIELTGYLFFGGCSRLRRLCDEELSAETGPPDSLVLDFSRVSGLDVSAALALVEFENRCAATGAGLLIAGGCPSVIATLCTVKGAGGGTIRSHDTLEDALFHIEEDLLRHAENREGQACPGALLDALRGMHPDFDPMRQFVPITADAGSRIISADDERASFSSSFPGAPARHSAPPMVGRGSLPASSPLR
jgi:SulP family sulfate permease